MLLQESQVAVVHVPVVVDDEVPHAVGAHSVEPVVGQGILLAGQIQCGIDALVASEDVGNGAGFGVKVAQPDEAVALDAVPNIVLHVQMDGIGAGCPNGVQALVVTLERALIGDVAVAEDGVDLLEVDGHVGCEQVNAHEAVSGVANLDAAVIRNGQFHVSHSVVVGGGVVLQVHGFVASRIHQ